MEHIPPPTRQDLLTIMSTEHFTLQGARSAAISDANGRTSFFLSTLSAGVVALAFVAQVAQTAFVVFALIVLPTVLVIGLASFERLLQLGIENIRIVVAINRVRHYYLEIAPELRPHFTLSDRDDSLGVLASLGSIRGGIRPWDLFVTNAGVAAIIDGIVSGVIAALVAATVQADARSRPLRESRRGDRARRAHALPRAHLAGRDPDLRRALRPGSGLRRVACAHRRRDRQGRPAPDLRTSPSTRQAARLDVASDRWPLTSPRRMPEPEPPGLFDRIVERLWRRPDLGR